MKWILALTIALTVALSPSAALAAPGDAEDDDFLMRIGADVVIPEGETAGSVVVIDGNVQIDGSVRNTVVVIDGDATVTGTIEGDLTVISGTINLQSGSSVQNVTSIRGDLFRDADAVVTGEVNERDNFQFFQGVAAIFSFFFWLGMSVAVVAAGLIFAAVGARQLTTSALSMTGDAVGSIIGVAFVVIGLPVLAVIAIATLIGLPLGLGLLFFLVPALWFLGYIVAGTRLGLAITRASGREPGAHPYLATFVGLVIFQGLILIPVLGGLVAAVAGTWGAGALAATAFRAARSGGKPLAPQPATGSEPQPA